MSSRGFSVAAGIAAGLVSLIVLACVELHIAGRLVRGDLGDGLMFAAFMLATPTILIPADVAAAVLISFLVYAAVRGGAKV